MRQLLVLVLQKYLSRVFKGALVCGLFAAIFQGQSNNNPTVHQVYVYIIKVGALSLTSVPDLSLSLARCLIAVAFRQSCVCSNLCTAFECCTLLKKLLCLAGAGVHFPMADCGCNQDHGCKADGWSLSSGDILPAHAGGSSEGAASSKVGLCALQHMTFSLEYQD